MEEIINDEIPWKRRKEIGFIKSLWQTFQLVTNNTEKFIDIIQKEKPQYFEPILLALGINYLVALIGIAISIIFELSSGKFNHIQHISTSQFFILLGFILIALFTIVLLFIGSSIVHGIAYITGYRKPFELTFMIVAYLSILDFFVVIPVAGNLIAFIWKILLLCTIIGRIKNNMSNHVSSHVN